MVLDLYISFNVDRSTYKGTLHLLLAISKVVSQELNWKYIQHV